MRRLRPFLLTVTLATAAAAWVSVDRWVDATQLPPLISETSVEVRDRDGGLLRAYTVADGLWRLKTDATQVDPSFIAMLVAFEDKRFYSHAGVDPLAMLRASWQALWYGQVVSGGSTLTMQVARLMEDSGTGSWRGKFRQMRLALALERKLTKEQILDLYLTHAPYGGNLEGLRAASRAYFGKEPTRLTPAQSALLVALPQSPEGRRPDRDIRRARAARLRVLERMKDAGVLSEEDVDAALTEPVPPEKRLFPSIAPHMADRAKAEKPFQDRHDLTINAQLQTALEQLGQTVLRDKGERLSIAMVVADHETGEILASVGSAAYGSEEARQGFVDMTRAARSPGSTLKPLVYALAFDQGMAHPETLIDDRPVAFGSYAPQNFDGKFRGELRVSEALKLSLNIPVVLLTDQLGPANLMAGLRRAGTKPRLPGGKPGLAVALGGVGITLEELVQLYAALGGGGQSVDLHWRQGQQNAEEIKVVSRSAAWQVGHILSGIQPPPGAAHSRLAYKTGTSYGHRDAWAVGFDGKHVAGVWIGRPDGTPVPGAFGGQLAAPVLFEVFQRLKPLLTPLPPPPPETLLLSTNALPKPLQVFQGRFAAFKEPEDAPKLAFPPDGARLAMLEDGLTVKIRDGALPLTVLANGRPLVTGVHQREITLPFSERGFSVLSVIDAEGRSARAHIRLD